MKLVLFHIYCNQTTPSILQDQITKIHFSGLYKKVDKLLCFVTGDPRWIQVCLGILHAAGKSFVIGAIVPNDTKYERTTLETMHRCVGPEDQVLYIHTKGVTRVGSPNITHWRTFLEYHLMTRADECIEALKTHDIVGVNWKTEPQPHFSGNMWWARGDYVLGLPRTIGPAYNDPEFWIGLGSPRVLELANSGASMNHYQSLYPYSEYCDVA
jgi:hypothetical protein